MQPWVGPSPSSSWQLCDFGQLLNPHPAFLICNVCAKSLQLCPTLCDPMDCGHQAPLSKEFSRQEYWSRLPFPSPGSVMWDHNKIYHLGLLWRRQWHPTPVLLPGKSYGQRSLVGCSPWGRWGSDTTERLHFHFSLSCIGEGNGNPLQCFCLENPRDGGAWWAAIYGVAQSRTRLKWLSNSRITMRIKWVNSFKSLRMASGTEQGQNKHVNRFPQIWIFNIKFFLYLLLFKILLLWKWKCESVSCSAVSECLQPHGL